ncbi:uncharacterized protein EI97DRAFT_103073 [Westerdykella ornata]|uniref:Piwi domain-containing protein n=1 Tax=Westerdykella ornata TaxID=318751 RepID=A0A6A6JG31_WESOR|nr:uncharacterized protein EI97DRAFT_103073 [Westerdykella ornata]KAF2274586.1 hypothetical protein EI97DRAFT_103073 [Westerdykella ornata]
MAGPKKQPKSPPVTKGTRNSSPVEPFSATSSETGTTYTALTSLSNQDVAEEKAVKDYKPNARVPIARLPYKLRALPALFVYEVDILAKTADNEANECDGQGADPSSGDPKIKQVLSQRLRQEALCELILTFVEPKFIGRVAIDMDAREGILHGSETVTKQGPTSYLIIPLEESENPADVWLRGRRVEGSILPLSKTKRKQRCQGPVQKEENIVCKMGLGKKLNPGIGGTDGRLYAKCFETIFRTYANLDGRKDFQADSADLLLPNCSYGTAPLGLSKIEPRIRCRPTIKIHGRDHAQVHLDYDLVPTMRKETNLTAVLDDYFLATGSRDAPSKYHIISRLLCGIRVNYKPHSSDEKLSTGQLDGGSVHTGKGLDSSPTLKNVSPASADTAAPDGSFPMTRVIRDIRPAAEMNSIFVETSQGYKSVKDLVGSASTSGVTHQKYPIANIGGKRPFWVPLHDLHVELDQIYRGAGHFTPDLKAALTKLQGHKDLMRDIIAHGQNYIKQALVAPQRSQHKSQTPYQLAVRQTGGGSIIPAKQSRNVDYLVSPRQRRDEANSITTLEEERLTVIYISHDDDGFELKLKERLEGPEQSTFRFTDVRTVHIKSLAELIRQQVDMHSPLMQAVFHPESSVIIGVLDRKNISADAYEEIRAELQRFGDRKPGAVTVCAHKHDLEGCLQRPGRNLFAANLMRKIKLMLGSLVWETKDVDYQRFKFDPGTSIVLGAHISHPDSGATNLCPSVASVVGSVDGNLTLFPGSTRLLQAKEKEGSALPSRYIEGLTDMMKERFEAWQAQSGQKATRPLKVLFYRSAYHIPDGETYVKEIEAIKRAYLEVFWSPLEGESGLAYMVMGKNSHSHTSRTFTTAEPGKEHAAKYQYFLPQGTNTTGLTTEQLAHVTATLNVTAQLGNISSKALPLAYAQKLARRVLDYFRWFSHKDITNFPPIARQAPYDAEDKAKEFKRFVEEYLSTTTKLGQATNERDFVKFRDDDKPLTWNSKLDGKMFYL